MMEPGWSANRVARQLGRSDCVVTIGSERCHEDQAQNTLDRPVVKTTTSKEMHAYSQLLHHPPPSRHSHWRLCLEEWCFARGNWSAAEWNLVIFSDEFRFNLSCDDNCVRV
ncbi:transposable element Tcb1 transposase [Trichonephila clavipes]|nr:transposable element Tcb1 transposase [Trichonephila clavipes]